ncbi:MAG: hypothetical protein QF437_18340, partial [Planctomycetota bacterium]|nr:hypothetical protein [Planctomycetota bacterium]
MTWQGQPACTILDFECLSRSNMFHSPLLLLLASFILVGGNAQADELVLAADGKSIYQIIVPAKVPSPAIGDC